MEWSIQEVARVAGTTSRTLRHYDDLGILAPTRIGSNGYRYYDESALTRLQRILMLRDLGLGLPAVADVIEGNQDDALALHNHLEWLQQEKQRLDRQISSVETTILKLEGGEQLMAEEMFNGFDHTVYKDEVEERWGKDAYAKSNSWWTSMTAAEKKEWQSQVQSLISDWKDAATRGISPDSDEAQALARRQYDWLSGIPGTPQANGGPTKEYFVGLGEMYVADDRFGANYGGVEGATFVRDTLVVYAERNL